MKPILITDDSGHELLVSNFEADDALSFDISSEEGPEVSLDLAAVETLRDALTAFLEAHK